MTRQQRQRQRPVGVVQGRGDLGFEIGVGDKPGQGGEERVLFLLGERDEVSPCGGGG
ncbi:hypothetical protein [Frankia casuarinae]|uniref:hypothetical protein n=1 Tax=Frankia casuarinae (strain DSM 45818 / CECT 9043 / HFP020203 / CcI3) TaxID=106370 RepID=UPI0013FE3EBD|nr:hypothetical protein [Frankia casuarinae]